VRRSLRRASIVASAAVLTLALGTAAAAVAAHHGRPRPSSAAREIRAAARLSNRIPRLAFARGTRSGVLAASRHAVRLTRTRRSCATLQSADRLLSLLSLPATWSNGRVSGKARKPVSLLSEAERTLVRAAGHRCAATGRMSSALRPSVGGGTGYRIVPAPAGPDNDQGEGINLKLPAGKYRPIKRLGTQSALVGNGPGPAGDGRGGPIAYQADDPLNYFRNTDTGIPPNQPGEPQEMTAAVGRNIAWETGNSSVGLSLNGGRTFTMFNPSNLLPDNGRGFCCDQQVVYSSQYDLFVWVMQYWCQTGCLTTNSAGKSVCPSGNQSNGSNRIRIAVTTPEELKADASNPGAAWTYWDLTPQLFGQPANAWFDRSDISVSHYNLQWSVDVLCPTSALLARVSLQQLLDRGTINIGYYLDANTQAMRVAQGQDAYTSYYAGNDSNSEAQIWSWDPGSPTLFRHDINHSSVPGAQSAVDGTDGKDWYGRYGIFPAAVDSATVSGNTLYLAQGTGRDVCASNCGSGQTPTFKQIFNQPAIYVSRYDVNSWNLVGERWLWNPTLAFAWPALQTDAAGDVGITFVTSANNQNAQPVAGFLTPSEQFVYADPAGGPYPTGDYGFLQPGRTDESFVFVGRTEQSDGNHWYYIEYGHGSPPPVQPPFVQITSPTNPPIPSYTQGATATYTGEATDPVDGTLSGASLVWTEDGHQIGTGNTITHVENVAGFHTITLTATNGEGVSASSSTTIQVVTPPPPGAPTVTITSPEDGTFFGACTSSSNGYYAVVQLKATASDPNHETLTYSWTDSIDGGPAQQVSTALSPTLDLYYRSGEQTGETTHDLTLTATDTSNKSNSTSIRVYVGNPGCIQ
jgi:hypothetical protein